MPKLNNNSNILFFITANYPYGDGETFIESEIEYLAKGFDKIVIFTHSPTSYKKTQLPNNMEVRQLSYEITNLDKIKSLVLLLDQIFIEEIKIIQRKYKRKISFGILKSALISLYNAKRLAKEYLKVSREYTLIKNRYFYSYWCNDSALALSLIQKSESGVRTVSRIHGWDVYFEPSKYNYLPYRLWISENLTAIFSISQKGVDYCINKWKINNKSVFNLSRLGVNGGEFLKEDSSLFLLVSCSNLISLKRIDLLVKSLSLIQFKLKWVHFGDGEKINELLQLSNETLKNNIDFEFKGRVENDLVLDYYKKCKPSLFINLSSSEGVPVSIMEAMSFGIPAIATNVGGNSEIVNDENGFLIEAHPNAQTVADKIIKYYNLRLDEKNIKREFAYNTWKSKYNAEKNYSSFIHEILSL